MNINNDNNDNNNFTNPQEYIDRLNLLDKELNVDLDNFRKTFILVALYPGNQGYQQQFRNDISNLWKVFSDQFTLYNDIQVSIDEISQKLLSIDNLISKEKEKNNKLKRKLGIVEQQSNTSSEMISNYKDIYDIRYLRNWGLLLSTIGCIYTISVIYKKQGV